MKYKHFSRQKRNARGGHLVFQNEAKNIFSQDFVMMNISCEFEISTYYISGVNGKLVYHNSFHLGRNDEIRKEYLSTGH